MNMNHNQRSFVKKMSKLQAADVRRHAAIASTHTISGISSGEVGATSCGGLYCFANAPLYEVVDPVDFETCVVQHTPARDAPKCIQQLAEFPADDVKVLSVPRHVRTLDSALPNCSLSELDHFTKDCFEAYSRNFTVYARKYEEYCTGELYNSQLNRDPAWQSLLTRQLFECDTARLRLSFRDEEKCSRISYASSASTGSLGMASSDGVETPRGSWASSEFDLRLSNADATVASVIERLPFNRLAAENDERRSQQRHEHVMSLYPLQPKDEMIECRTAPAVPSELFGHRLLIKIQDMRIDNQLEPIFATAAIHDVRARHKLSENFYFDVNAETLKGMLKAHIPYQDVSSLSRSAIFSITHPTPDLYLIVKLERVLQPGELSETIESFVKEDKTREKVRTHILEHCDRLGAYRMPFAWAAVYLHNVFSGASALERSETLSNADGQSECGYCSDTDSTLSESMTSSVLSRATMVESGSLRRVGSGSLVRRTASVSRASYTQSTVEPSFDPVSLDKFRPITVTVQSFFAQEQDKLTDMDLYKLLSDAKRPMMLAKKLQCIPGTLKVEISPCPPDVDNCLTPELLRVHPYPDSRALPVKEVLEFPLKEVFTTNVAYRNLLYVYPRFLNFSARPGSARNIAVKVHLLRNEELSSALEVIFGRSSCPEFSQHFFTNVTYHNKTPVFYDEIKIKLPCPLEEQHHLLFTFCHISCKAPKIGDVSVEQPVGYTWLPLFRNGRLQLGEFALPVCLETLPKSYSYLTPDINLPNMKWLENHKGLFTVEVKATSTIHTQDPYLDRFWTLVFAVENGRLPPGVLESTLEHEFRKAVTDLMKARPEPLVHFLDFILDKLLALVVTPIRTFPQLANTGQISFEMIGQIVKVLSFLLDSFCDRYGRSSLLTSYIAYTCRLPHPQQRFDGSCGSLGRHATVPAAVAMHHKLSSPGHSDLFDIIKGFEKAGHFSGGSEDRLHVPKACRLVHEELALHWVVSTGPAREMAIVNAWFFLELLLKAMAEHLAATGRFYLPRHVRFSSQYLDDQTNIVQLLTAEVISRCSKDLKLARRINAALAFFIRDAFSLMDRSYLFGLIRGYCKQVLAKVGSLPNAASLMLLKIEFMRILCSHEHFITLNLPFLNQNLPMPLLLSTQRPESPSPSISSRSSAGSGFLSSGSNQSGGAMMELSNEYKSQHYLLGLVLADLGGVLETNNALLHYKAINVVRNLLTAHDLDARLREPAMRTRVAMLYVPLLGIVLDSSGQLYDPKQQNKTIGGPSGKGVTTNVDIALQIAVGHELAADASGATGFTAGQRAPLTLVNTRNLLILFCWVLKNLDRSALRQWLSELASARITQLLDTLQLCVSCFEYRVKCRAESGAKTVQRHSRLTSALVDQEVGGQTPTRWRKEHIALASRESVEMVEPVAGELEQEPLVDGNLATEVNLVVLDTLECVVAVLGSEHGVTISLVLRVLLHMLACNQSVAVLENVFASQRVLFLRYPSLLEEEKDQCAELCLQLLRHCASTLSAVRAQAAGSLYALMRQSFVLGACFARAKVQITMSLSALVGTAPKSQHISENCLRRSLKTVLTYVDEDVIDGADRTFGEQVKDLTFNLNMILSDTVRMKEFQNGDFEMLMDLMYRIAKGYQNSPDLRLTWLQSMSQKHVEKGNFAEAAQCVLHCAALVAEYLNMLEEDIEHRPAGCVDFVRLSDNILEESAVNDDVVSPDEEGICESRYFSEWGLCTLLENAADLLYTAQQYECMALLYQQLLTPVYTQHRDYAKLAATYERMAEALRKIGTQGKQRVFGTYFRVGFYGALLGDLDGSEFVYKEPSITKLPEISGRLESFYAQKLGAGSVVMIKDSNPCDRSRLDADKAYIQVTYLEPFFDEWELRRRPTYFEQHHCVRRFVFSTPFTADGKAHGELHEQYKRKTIVTTTHSFPYMKTRVPVQQREQIVLTPIEVAIEDVQKKTQELAAATQQEPKDAKMLQMVLQGCIGECRVNQGPMEVANVFLGANLVNGDSTRPPFDRLQNRLRLAFKDFSKKCADGLRENKRLIGPDQKDYQKELERNYLKLTERLAPLVAPPGHVINA